MSENHLNEKYNPCGDCMFSEIIFICASVCWLLLRCISAIAVVAFSFSQSLSHLVRLLFQYAICIVLIITHCGQWSEHCPRHNKRVLRSRDGALRSVSRPATEVADIHVSCQ